MFGISQRSKYYVAFVLANLQSSYSLLRNTQDKNNSINNSVRISQVELSGSPRAKVANWNITSANWLRNCVFEPLISLGYSKSSSQLITNMVSAFWHGLFPCYYLTFFIMNTMVNIEKILYAKGHQIQLGLLYHFFFDLGMVYFKCY